MSKGSRTRPLSVSKEVFDQNWDRIFVGKTQVPFTAKEIPNAKKKENDSKEERLETNSRGGVGL
jgi:hypothetical protein